jgi:hypothetical protein
MLVARRQGTLAVLLAGVSLIVSLTAGSTSAAARAGAAGAYEAALPAYDKALRTHVKLGRVSYTALKRDRRGVDAMAAAVAKLPETASLDAFINAYNVIVLKAVLDRYPIKSVQDVPGFFDKLRFEVAGRALTLNELENSVIRQRFKDARVHFALNCASTGCPPLLARAFRAADLDATLDELTRTFVGQRKNVEPDANYGRILLNELFKWYEADFVRDAGSLRDFLAKYSSDRMKPDMLQKAWKLEFGKYDWSLNEAAAPPK